MVWCSVPAVSGLGLARRVVPPAHGGRFTESGWTKMGGDVRRAIQLVGQGSTRVAGGGYGKANMEARSEDIAHAEAGSQGELGVKTVTRCH